MNSNYKRTLVTSALPYINGTKHLGNMVGSILPADIYARFLRLIGKEVLFVCGTDEHGTPAELSAREAGLSVRDYCDKYHAIQHEIYKKFNITFDYFGRSSSLENKELTQNFFRAMDINGFIGEKLITQLYSEVDCRFLPDRYIQGTCPSCEFLYAKGDQCDGCGALLEPAMLLNPRSAISGDDHLVLRDSKHLYFRLDLLEGYVQNNLDAHDQWSSLVKGITRKWLMDGLNSRCITRDLDWGVDVPKEGFEGKVFYVWYDAPIAYISITKQWAKSIGHESEWKRWWTLPEDVRLVQFMAKDNVAFHTVFWPAMLEATKQQWVSPTDIKAFNWLTYDGGKFSTSMKRGVFLDDAVKMFPSDYWRYGLISNSPESHNSDFSFDIFAERINKDLADTLGNFYSRVVRIVEKEFLGTLPTGFTLDVQLKFKVEIALNAYLQNMHAMEFRKSISFLKEIWAIGNSYINAEAPWKYILSDRARASIVLKNCIFLFKVYGLISSPVIPDISKKFLECIGQDNCGLCKVGAIFDEGWLEGEVKVSVVNLFVEKVSLEQIASLKSRFMGEGA